MSCNGSTGRLWVGTFDEGLDCFDPRTGRFLHFRHNPDDPNSICPGPITALHEDNDGALWIGTAKAGLARLDPSRQQVTRFACDGPKRGRLSSNSIKAICQDYQGRVWVATDRGLNLKEAGSNEFRTYSLSTAGDKTRSGDFVTCLASDPSGNLWVGTRTKGLFQIDSDAGTARRIQGSTAGHTTGLCDSITSLYQSDPQHLWVGTVSGLFQLDLRTRRCQRFVHDPLNGASLSSDYVRRIKPDRTGTIWIVTDLSDRGFQLSGVNKLVARSEPFAYYSLVRPNGERASAQGLLHDERTNTTWIGGSDGLRAFHRRTGRIAEYRHDPSDPRSLNADFVSSLCLDPSGTVWAGTWKDGLSMFQPSTSCFKRFRWRMTNGEMGGSAITLCPDSGGGSASRNAEVNLWVGGFDEGLIYFSASQGILQWFRHAEERETSLGNDRVLALLVDRRGTLWVGTDGGGLNRYDRRTKAFIRYKHLDSDPLSLRSSSVYAIAEDPASYATGAALLWLGTATGLDHFDESTGQSTHPILRDSSEAISVIGLMVDRSKLWISTENNGLFERDLGSGAMRSFDAKNGLPSNTFTRGIARGKSGEILLGQLEGYIEFSPDSIRNNPHPPPVALTGFNVFDAPYPTELPLWNTPLLSLRYDQDFFSFRFAALDFSDPSGNRFLYKLEGFDEHWNRPGTRNFAGYTKVDPGEYTFRIKGANSDGVWNETGASIRLLIHPPYWQTWWFRTALGIIGLTLISGVYRYRVSKLIEMERMRLRIAGDLHDDIGSNLSGIALVTESLRGRAGLEERDRERLADVSRAARRTADALRDIVWIVNPTHDSVDDLLLRLKDATAMILTGIDYTISTTGTSLSKKMPIEFRRNLILIYKEILNNIARHAEARHVRIGISRKDSTFTLRIVDDGKGFDPSSVVRGNGLNSMSDRASSIGGTLTIVSRPCQGTDVTLTATL